MKCPRCGALLLIEGDKQLENLIYDVFFGNVAHGKMSCGHCKQKIKLVMKIVAEKDES